MPNDFWFHSYVMFYILWFCIALQSVRPAGEDDIFAVNIIRKKTLIHRCTGALYRSDVVLLPASCISGRGRRVLPEPYPLTRVGTLDIDGDDNAGGIEIRQTLDRIIHNGFNGTEEDGYSNDIAILFLNESITNHKSIELAKAPCNFLESLGWFRIGHPDGGGAPARKLERITRLKHMGREDCEKHLPHGKLPKGAICAIGPAEALASWDHGALLLCDDDLKTLVGLASFRTSNVHMRAPNIYTNLLDYKEWIQEQIEGFKNGKRAAPNEEL